MRLLLASVFLLGVSACQCGPSGQDAGVPGRAISVVRQRTLISSQGRTDVPFDLRASNEGASLTALVPENGSYRVVQAEGTAEGTAVLRGVPDGSYFVTFNGYSVQTSVDDIDLGLVDLGRSDVALSDGGVVLGLKLSGLSPWVQFSDSLQLSSGQGGYVAVNLQAYATQPDAGDTQVSIDVDYINACSTQRARLTPLIDTSKGDDVTIAQLSSSEQYDDAGVKVAELRLLERFVSVPALTVADRARTEVTAALATGAMTEVPLQVDLDAFEAVRPAVNVAAFNTNTTVTVSALPWSADDGFYTASPDLGVLLAQVSSGRLDSTLRFHNPYPASWPLVGSVRYETTVNYAYPDGGTRTIPVAISSTDLLSKFNTGPITPKVTPPINLTLDSAPAGSRQVISLTPTVRWTPPTIGTPTSYVVTMFRLSRVGDGPVIRLSEAGVYETTEQSLLVPLGQLEAGAEYVFAVTAVMAPGTDVTRAPFKGKLPFHSATALSALVTVEPVR